MVQVHPLLDPIRLLHDLQQVKEIAQSLSGRLVPAQIARQVTDALVDRLGCALARIWLVEPDQSALRLVASSGLYTHTDGFFARVPMGAYKVGKIALNRVPFLSNQLAEETWVKDRQWAIDNQIQGFAGYPLAMNDRVVGVLASFSHAPLAPEFLEVLQVLCMTVTVALDAALQIRPSAVSLSPIHASLSDQIAHILGGTQFALVGTERDLRPAFYHLLVQTAETLRGLDCSYCRLTYSALDVRLEAIVVVPDLADLQSSPLADLQYLITCLGGTLDWQPVMQGQACQVSLMLPAAMAAVAVQVRCRQGVLQQGFCQLVHQAGLTIGPADSAAVLITDTLTTGGTTPILWVRQASIPTPEQAIAVVDLATTPTQLRQVIDRVMQESSTLPTSATVLLSEREQQVMQLLAEGKRDRDIAQALYISESTVKFHINNSLAKLKAKNRYQGVYQAALRGWI